jgi:hypothetical protein
MVSARATLNMPVNKPAAHKPTANELRVFIVFIFLFLIFTGTDLRLDVQAGTLSFTRLSYC